MSNEIIVARRRRYLERWDQDQRSNPQSPTQDPLPVEHWAQAGYRAGMNRLGAQAHALDALDELGLSPNDPNAPITYPYDPADPNGPQLRPDAVTSTPFSSEGISHNGVIVEVKARPSSKLIGSHHNPVQSTRQLRAQRKVARAQGMTHVLVLTSDDPSLFYPAFDCGETHHPVLHRDHGTGQWARWDTGGSASWQPIDLGQAKHLVGTS